MSGTEAAWLPWAGAALGGLGGYLGGSRPEQAEISGYGQKFPTLHPEQLFKGATGDLGRLGALYAQRAQTPVSMPSSYVQPLPMFKGGVVDAFGLGMDPAFPRPELMTRSGVNFGSEEALPFRESLGSHVGKGGRDVYGSSTQPASPFPTFGGAHSELGDMQKALAMLRPSGAPGFQFTGARGGGVVVPDGGDEDNDSPVPTPDINGENQTITDSSGQPVPVDFPTGQPLPQFPDGTIGDIVGSGDYDNPGSNFIADNTGLHRGVTRRQRGTKGMTRLPPR